MYIYFSLLVAVLGLLLYVLASNPKLQELGRLSFACGLLVFLLRFSSAAFGILK